MPIHEKEKFEDIDIVDVAYEGKGVGKKDGYVYFVPKTVTGDKVRVEITRQRKNFSDGLIDKIIKPSTDRIDPPCPYYIECGGCHYMHISYENQLKLKTVHLTNALQKIGKIPDPPVKKMVPSPCESAYRNRSIFHQSDSKRTGYISIRKDEIIDIENCLICEEPVNKSLRALRAFIKMRPDLGQKINHLSVRATGNPPSISLLFSVKSSIEDGIFETIDAFHELKPLSLIESMTPKDSSLIFSDSFKKLHGPDVVRETLGEFAFELSHFSFFQVNTAQAENLIEMISHGYKDSFAGKKILELYSGVGLFSTPVSKISGAVLAIESSRDACSDANRNRELNGNSNLTCICGRVREETAKLIRQGEKFDVALLDPPRQGADKDLLANFPRLGIEKIFYISCSPPTLARDLNFLGRLGYKLQEVIPIDMFPQTYHIESLSILVRG